MLYVSYRNSMTDILGETENLAASRVLPAFHVGFNRGQSNSGSKSVTFTTRGIQDARLIFLMASRCIVRKPRQYMGQTIWQWGFPRVYWFQSGSKSKSKGGSGFHTNKMSDFRPSVVSDAAPTARLATQVDFASAGMLDVVLEFEKYDGWTRHVGS